MLKPRPLTTLRIAVTGHRDLDPAREEDIRRAVREAIVTLTSRCSPARVELLTGMADGADQLVADVAAELGCDIHIVLPKPMELYRTELSETGAARLSALISEDGVAVSAIGPEHPGADNDLDTAAPYERLALYLAKSAHVLIALWDGKLERKPGGTLDALSCYLDRNFRTDRAMDLPSPIEFGDEMGDLPSLSAIWICSDRSGADEPTEVATAYLVSSGLPGVWRSVESMPNSLARMLDDLAGVSRVSAAVKAGEPGYPLLEHLPNDIDSATSAALGEIHDAYLEADRLAVLHQSRSEWSFVGASVIAAAMGFAFLWFAKIDDHVAWLYGYLGLFLVGYALFRIAHSRHWLGLHLALRVLAETLRIRFFTTLLGISESVDVRRVLVLTGVSSFPGFAWAGEADRIGIPKNQHRPTGMHSTSEFVSVEWVDDQAGYFQNKISQLRARHHRLEMIQRVLYVMSFVTVIVIIAYGTELKTVHAPGDVSLKTILIFLMGLLPLWLTIWELHQGRMATREMLWQSLNQADIFSRAATHLGEVETDEAREQIYVELAESSLFATYRWTIHRFHREFTPPSGG